MYVIQLKDGTIHSAWLTQAQAQAQIDVLEDYGYRSCTFKFMDIQCANGQYFV